MIFKSFTSHCFDFSVRIHGEKNIKKYGSSEILVNNPAHFPDPTIVDGFFEPIVLGTIITPGNSNIC